MLKKTITYEDYNGDTRTEDFYFNLTRTELIEMEYTIGGNESLTETIKILTNEKDNGEIIRVIKNVILHAYGEKSPDGRRFIKNQDIRDAFEQNPAYDVLYMELASDAKASADFFAGLLPSSITSQMGDNPGEELISRMKEAEKLTSAKDAG